MELEQLAFQLCPPLSPLDREIIRAAITGESYQVIADRLWYCHEHVRDRGSKLFKRFSERLNRDISKQNFRQELERVRGLVSESRIDQGHRWGHSRVNVQRSARSNQISFC